MSTHTGTHVDAPSHFGPRLASIDRVPASSLVCNAVLVKAPKRANQKVEPADFANVSVMRGDAVVIATRWENRVTKSNYMTENPGLSGPAAKYLASRNVNAVAIDSPNIDAGADRKFTAHNILLPRKILIIENICNLANLPKNRFTLVISPLKLEGASGSPARILALL